MRRAAPTLARSVIPAITQIPYNLPDDGYQIVNQVRWNDEPSYQISPGLTFSNDSTTTTTTSTTTSLTRSDEIASRLDGVYDQLQLTFSDKPVEAALLQVAIDTISDPNVDLVNKISKFPSFQALTSTLSSVRNVPRVNPAQNNVISLASRVSMGTQTEDFEYMAETYERLQDMALQISPAYAPPSVSTITTSPLPVTVSSSQTVASTSQSINNSPTPAPPSYADSAFEQSDVNEGSAGVPGKTSNPQFAIVFAVIPLAILAVAAVVAFPKDGAIAFLKTGVKYISRILTKQI